MKRILEQFNREREDHVMAAEVIENWSTQSQTMKPLSLDQIIASPFSVLALNDERSVLGHIAVTELKGYEAIVGGLIVGPEKRAQGIGHELVKYFVTEVPEKLPEVNRYFAYANKLSVSLFLAAGGLLLENRFPREPNGCNQIVDLSPGVQICSP